MSSYGFSLEVIHCSKFHDRKLYLEKRLMNVEGLVVNWISEDYILTHQTEWRHTKEVFGRSLLSCAMELGINARTLIKSRRRSTFESFLLLLRYLMTKKQEYVFGSLPNYTSSLRQIDLEVQQMHLQAIRNIVSSGQNWSLVLEDDAIFEQGAFDEVEKIADSLDSDSSVWVSLNDGAGLKRTKSDKSFGNLGLFKVRPPAVRCCSAYLISRVFAEEFLELAEAWGLPDWLPMDYIFHLSMRRIRGAKTLWIERPLFVQGSESGAYKSGLR